MHRAKDTGDPSTEGKNICAHRKDNGDICTNPAGLATNHPGYSYCWKHDYREAGMGVAKIVEIVARSPEVAHRAQAYLDSDSELLNARRELAVLKARFELMHYDPKDTDDSDVPKRCQLANTISLMTRRIQDIEIARKHYIHINVLTHFTADFSRIAKLFVPEDMLEEFIDTLEASIRETIPKSNARGIASRLMVSEAENAVVDVDDYEITKKEEGE